MKLWKKLAALTLALVLLFALASCGSSSSSSSSSSSASVENSTSSETSSASEETDAEDTEDEDTSEVTAENTSSEITSDVPIKIGHVVDLTGTEALTGEEAERSLQFAVDQLGGINGHPVEVVVADAQGDSGTAVDVARMMVENEGVVAIFGPTQAGQKAALAEYCKEAEVPLITYSGTPAYLFEDNEWLVGVGGANPQLTVMADYCYNDLGYRNVYVLTNDNVGFKTFTDDFTTAFEGLGGTVISSQYAEIPTSDWAPYLVTLNANDADANMVWTTGSNAISLWESWYDAGLADTLPITAILQSGFTEYTILDSIAETHPEVAEAIMGTISPCMYTYSVDSEENNAFVAAWKEEFGTVPQTNLPGQCYQAYLLLKTAMESIGADSDTDSQELLDAILATDVTGPCGETYFDGSNACIRDVYITKNVQLEDGSYNYELLKTYENVAPEGLLG